MGIANCNEFLNQLELWMEGERGAEAQAHMRNCPQCRGIVNDLDSIHQVARSMDEEDVAPPEHVWTTLRAQLKQEGLIHEQHAGRTSAVGRWFEGVFSAVPRPALAGAYLVALVAVSVALAGSGYRRFDWNQASTQPLRAELNSAERNTISMVDSDPVVSASLQRNLAIVDNYIALCEKSVQEEPDNEAARDYLYDAYQQKADLLAQITERGDDR